MGARVLSASIGWTVEGVLVLELWTVTPGENVRHQTIPLPLSFAVRVF